MNCVESLSQTHSWILDGHNFNVNKESLSIFSFVDIKETLKLFFPQVSRIELIFYVKSCEAHVEIEIDVVICVIHV